MDRKQVEDSVARMSAEGWVLQKLLICFDN